LKVILTLLVLFLITSCANRQPSYTNTYQNNSIPAVQYDNSYKAGCNKAIFRNSTESYSGGFCFGKKKGAGIAIYNEPPSKYDGNFDNDVRNGWGTYSWYKTDDSYTGNFKAGARNGFGIYTWGSDGSYESGMWENDKREGEHKLYAKGGVFIKSRMYRGGVLLANQTDPSPSKPYSSPNSPNPSSPPSQTKNQKCKRLGLVEGTPDFYLCLKSLKD
jgi:hypothetical protein